MSSPQVYVAPTQIELEYNQVFGELIAADLPEDMADWNDTHKRVFTRTVWNLINWLRRRAALMASLDQITNPLHKTPSAAHSQPGTYSRTKLIKQIKIPTLKLQLRI